MTTRRAVPHTMKIAELAEVSGTHRSTIHHYRNLGLLPPPEVRGPKLHLYSRAHVERLRTIARLLDRGLSLSEIHLRLERSSTREPRAADRPTAPPRRARRGPSTGRSSAEREAILDAAAALFLQRGYDAVRVEDVAREVGIGKATFYQSFRSKTDLFVDCLERLRFAAIPAQERALLDRSVPLEDEARARAMAVLARFRPYRMMTNLIASAAYGSDPEIAARAKQAFHRMVTNAEPMIRRAIESGTFRPMDSEMVAYMTWGALIAAGDRLALDDAYTLDDALRIYGDFIGAATRATPRA